MIADYKVTRDTDGDGNIDVWMALLETGTEHVARGIYLMIGGGIYNEAGDFILNSPENATAFQVMDDLIHVDGIAAVAPSTHDHARPEPCASVYCQV